VLPTDHGYSAGPEAFGDPRRGRARVPAAIQHDLNVLVVAEGVREMLVEILLASSDEDDPAKGGRGRVIG